MKIVNINVNDLIEHPDNPRKMIGDISELTESIKSNGIMQPLTVVESIQKKGAYMVVIGHRRLKAAKAAGVETVPCIISGMERKTQLTTMLEENMQRKDLTPLEEAQGIQLVIDEGATMQEVSQKTGISKATIKKRIKMLNSFEEEKLQRAMDKQITMSEIEKLYKIESKAARNKLLEKAGTKNFEFELNEELSKQKRKKLYLDCLEKVKKYFKPCEKGSSYTIEYYYTSITNKTEEELKALSEKEELHYKESGDTIVLYKEIKQKTAKEKAFEQNKEYEKKQHNLRIQEKLSAISYNAYKTRIDYVKGLKGKKEVSEEEIISFTAQCLYLLKDRSSIGTIEKEEVKDIYGLAVKAFEACDIYKNAKLTDYKNEFADYAYKYLRKLYEILELIGYEKSEQEEKWLDGTHELYKMFK